MYQNVRKNSGNKQDDNNDEYDRGYQSNLHQSNKFSQNTNVNTTSSQQQQTKNKQNKDNQRFNIVVRIRPQVENDLIELTTEDELRHCIFKQGPNKISLTNEKTDSKYEMMFDHVFGENDKQETLYNAFGEKLLKDIFRGYNGTIMAYGQTGSGKTYTMFGRSLLENQRALDTGTYAAEKGIVQRAIKQIFEYKNQNKDKKDVSIYVSFMQIYLNQITDLLDERSDVIFSVNKPIKENENKPQFRIGKESKNLNIENSLKIGHDKDGKIYVKGLKIKEVNDETKLLILIENGITFRRTAETIMNKISSRSHAILQITIKQMWKERIKNNSNGETVENFHRIKGILTIVDLAGSESISRTGSEGLNQDEAKEINKSISALGRVIESLSKHSQYLDRKGLNEKNANKAYISYRDSKLTEILSECLGGNSKTYIIANVSPFAANCEETYSTLQFARRAMVIRTSAKKNEKVSTKKFNKEQELISSTGYQNNDNNKNNNNAKKNTTENNNNLSGAGNSSVYKNKSVGSNRYGNLYGLDKNYNNKEAEDDLERKKEEYQAITKKFYSIIIHLQEELGKLTIQNYTLEQENKYLKEHLKNLS